MDFSTMDIYPSREASDTRLGGKCGLIVLDFSHGLSDLRSDRAHLLNAAKSSMALQSAFWEFNLPVAHTRLAQPYADEAPGGSVPKVDHVSHEFVVAERSVSAFEDIRFNRWLSLQRIETLVIAGFATSHSVLATALDAHIHKVRPLVVEDCVGDVHRSVHESCLFDLHQKSVDILPRDLLIRKISTALKTELDLPWTI